MIDFAEVVLLDVGVGKNGDSDIFIKTMMNRHFLHRVCFAIFIGVRLTSEREQSVGPYRHLVIYYKYTCKYIY